MKPGFGLVAHRETEVVPGDNPQVVFHLAPTKASTASALAIPLRPLTQTTGVWLVQVALYLKGDTRVVTEAKVRVSREGSASDSTLESDLWQAFLDLLRLLQKLFETKKT